MFRRILIGAALWLCAVAPSRGQFFTQLHVFDYNNGGTPDAKLTLAGNRLYSATFAGGLNGGGGTVYGVDVDGSNFALLWSFAFDGDTNGFAPVGPLVLVGDTLYGALSQGGASGNGTVFAMSTNGGSINILHAFTPDYGGPASGVTLAGNQLIGTTFSGSIYSMNLDGSGFTNLYVINDTNAAVSLNTPLCLANGKLYGAAGEDGSGVYGFLFSLNTDGSDFRVIRSFTDFNAGGAPPTGLALLNDTLYGTLQGGPNLEGVLFSVKTNGADFTTLHVFGSSADDGQYPKSALVLDPVNGTLYGATDLGGAEGSGVVFAMNLDGSSYRNVYEFSGGDGYEPDVDLLLSSNTLYGATVTDAGLGWGTLFSLGLYPPPRLRTGNLVINPGFETGTFAGWQVASPSGGPILIPGDDPHSGDYAVDWSEAFPGDVISQTVPTVAGQIYEFSFWLDTSPALGTPVFTASWNGASVFDLTSFPLFPYQQFNFVETATGPATTISFTGLDAADGFSLDDVNVSLATNLVSDSDMEEPSVFGGESFYNFNDTIGPWVIEGNEGDQVAVYDNGDPGAMNFFPTPDGRQFAALGGTTALRQTLTGPLHAGTTYSVSVLQSTFNVSDSLGGAVEISLYPFDSVTPAFDQIVSLSSDADWTLQQLYFIPPADGNYTLRVGSTPAGNCIIDTITVEPTPLALSLEIVSQPIGQQAVTPGSSVSFSVGAQSSVTSALQYQWQLNGVNIVDATNATLFLNDAEPVNGGVYTVTVSDGDTAVLSDPAVLTLDLPFVSGNDNVANAAVLPSDPSGSVNSENIDATAESGEPSIFPGNPPRQSIWFAWTAISNGIATFTTAGSGFDTVLGAFDGNLAAPAGIADDDGGGNLTSLITFNAVAGHTYLIGVDGHQGASGNVTLSWNEAVTDDVVPTVLVPPVPVTVLSNAAPATFTCQAPNSSVLWFNAGDPLNPVAGGENFSITHVDDATVGTYYAVVSSQTGESTRTQPFQVQINLLEDGTSATNSLAYNKFLDAAANPFVQPPPLPQVRRTGGGDTRGFTTVQVYSTAGNKSEPGEPSICGQIGGAPEWYAYTAPTNGALLVNTAGSGFNTMLGVFAGDGTSLATLTSLGCGYTVNRAVQPQPSVFVPNIAAHQTVYIVVDGYHGASGPVHLNINLGQPVTAVVPPQDQYLP
ncbi:MAG TPA: choice-of-anchor tandem repeat GloVer-containing protein, partial [Verrucomicrobiae bacterium]|nr:choice-of-anchor tandem repeat GloVer-containing protein [Verrucomicrobiae bacterium]